MLYHFTEFSPFSPFSPFLTISLCSANHYFSNPVFFDSVPCIQSVGIFSILPLCCPSISFSVNLCSVSQNLLVLAISHRCGCIITLSSGQTTLVICFSRKCKQVLCALPSRCLNFLCDPIWSSLLLISTYSFRLNLVCFHLSLLQRHIQKRMSLPV